MDFSSFLLGVFLINQLVTIFIAVESRKSTQELSRGVDRLCSFLTNNK